mmetsp:Transcript_28063/g.72176  ORF Transcript_28063/g.72176 Transcript_28063/m.72176 type:complete len:318 (-) Transcript_28063:72-1025(-)
MRARAHVRWLMSRGSMRCERRSACGDRRPSRRWPSTPKPSSSPAMPSLAKPHAKFAKPCGLNSPPRAPASAATMSSRWSMASERRPSLASPHTTLDISMAANDGTTAAVLVASASSAAVVCRQSTSPIWVMPQMRLARPCGEKRCERSETSSARGAIRPGDATPQRASAHTRLDSPCGENSRSRPADSAAMPPSRPAVLTRSFPTPHASIARSRAPNLCSAGAANDATSGIRFSRTAGDACPTLANAHTITHSSWREVLRTTSTARCVSGGSSGLPVRCSRASAHARLDTSCGRSRARSPRPPSGSASSSPRNASGE